MNKKQSSMMASMRKKLLAAVAMLLVACIMTVSSTYAWFTLSTAPEVKGISTNIGANGNLEMALATYETLYGSRNPETGTSSSITATNDWVATNTTWGNLVNLSTGYGLDKISLYPTRLNASGNTLSLLNPLKFPSYGSDGRIIKLEDSTMLGKYDSVAQGFNGLATPNYAGVNAIGAASSMSERAFAVRNGKADLESNRVNAKNAAEAAIRNYAGDLAGLAIKHMNSNDDNAVVTAAEKQVLANLIAQLQIANGYISESMKSAILVTLAAWTPVDVTDPESGAVTAKGLPDDVWEVVAGAAATKDIAAYVTFLTNVDNGASFVTLPDGMTQYVTNYESINTDLSTALGALGDVTQPGIWGDVKNAVGNLLDANGILICGYTAYQIRDSKNNVPTAQYPDAFNEVATAVMNGGLEFQFSKTSGIFADIAQFTGSYTAQLTFPAGIEVEGIPLGGVSKPVTVQSGSINTTKGDLGLVSGLVEGMEALDGGNTDEAKVLTDTYGYTIDLLFRTNATDSFLKLQTEGKNRYDAGASDQTMGSGSNITFTLDDANGYDVEKVSALASGIRVVFYSNHSTGTNSATILGVAVLDVANAQLVGNDLYKVSLKLLNEHVEEQQEVTDENGTRMETIITTRGYSIASDGKLVIDDGATFKDDAKLCDLTANVKTAISALVYLDGDAIDNSHAGALDSLDASVNLQFASSVELKPMKNNDLMNGANEE